MQFLQTRQIFVDSYIRYSTDAALAKNQEDWDARTIRFVLKRETFKGFIAMKCAGVHRSVYENNAHLVEHELMGQCASHIASKSKGLIEIVPVPNSNATLASQEFNTLKHAKTIAKLGGHAFSAQPLLVWSAAQEKTHLGRRSRFYKDHMESLILNGTTQKHIVLYDDVVTTGSQLVACKLKLEAAGHTVIGMVAVLSVLEKDGVTHSDLFHWKTETRTYNL